MRSKQQIDWFLTDRGRAFSMYSMAAVAAGITSVTYFPQSFFLDKYKEFVQNYSNGKEVPLSNDLQQKFQKCVEILEVPELHKKLLKPFSVFGFDLFSTGSCKTKFGVLIGIPSHFNYKTKEDIDRDQILINQKKIEWDSEAGRKLEDALVLPEKVKLFAICREILSTQNHKLFLNSSYPMISVGLIFTIGQVINHKANLYAAPRIVRGGVYTLLGAYGIGLYFFLKDYTEVYYESDVDKKLCKLGPDFIESGVIFYDKILKRNQALRELMGKEGESKYSTFGNENFFLRQPRIALVHRKMFFESQLKSAEKETNETTN